jgi:hypothetical protein
MADLTLVAIHRIATDAHGRYKAGFSVGDAIDAACCGRGLDDYGRMLVESQVIASICKDEETVDRGFATLALRIACRRPAFDPQPILDRARRADLHEAEAAAMSVCAHDGRLWEIVDRIARGRSDMIKPATIEGLAYRQTALARQIFAVRLDARLATIVALKLGEIDTMVLDALTSITACREIHDALAQVRHAFLLMGGSDD